MGIRYIKIFIKRTLSIIWIGILVFSFSLLLFHPHRVQAQDRPKNVLLINSYHKGFTWTDDITDAITKTFKDGSLKIDLSVEYMDWKNFPKIQNLNLFDQTISYKYKNKVIDLIITSDDAALNYVLANRDKLFKNVPIVFSGIYTDTAKGYMEQNKNITGVAEKINPKGTIAVALNVNPNLQKIYVFHDNTESGIQAFHDVIKGVRELDRDLDVISLSSMSHSDIISGGLKLSQDSIILMTTFVRDIEGRTMEMEEWVNLLSKNTSVPVYDLYEMGIGHGSVGGSVVSGTLEGEEAANIAIRILAGEDISHIPLREREITMLKFDYNQLYAFSIPVSKLPKDSIIINKPFSFYEVYKRLVWTVLIIFLLMAVFIVILYTNIRQRKKAEKDLLYSHEELSSLYEELAASEEELRVQNQLLEENRNEIQQSEERYKLVFEASNEGLWELDTTTNEMFFSERWYDIFDSISRDKKISHFDSWLALIHPEDRDRASSALASLKTGKSKKYECEYRVQNKNGEYQWVFSKGIALRDENNNIKRMAGSHTNIHERKLQQEKIKQLAYYDPLTGLPNRTFLSYKLHSILRIAKENGEKGAVIFIDIDNFKMINDAFGHTFGDMLLKHIGERLKEKVRQDVHIGRLGGDEFLILFEAAKQDEMIEGLAKEIIECFAEDFIVEEKKLHITTSIGIAKYPGDGDTPDDLLKNADTAMYRAKYEGKNRYRFFEKSMNEDLAQKMLLQNSLRNALERNEFVLYYQPEVDTFSKSIYGFEALIRWISPEHGFVSPLKFIHILEETGMIVEVGKWVFKNACEFARKINIDEANRIIVSINVSPIQLMHNDFVEDVKDIIASTEISPELIGFEITETALMESFAENIDKLYKLRALGVMIILDDFGTGYSSLNYLRKMPIDILKIDKSFVDDLNSEEGKPLAESIVALAHSIGLKVVAEGVETEDQFNILQKYKCDLIQGYLISKPVPQEETLKLF
ncbi:PAS domain S-box-containing protein/diguanylate cyclase (GGDEF) domain-containing protein [Geosporobacter subterraneus DSM 17957]|uniref:PAS domain S-box-containing protein/diguanylate cyclase (GGDEF) domain-containing protein n=1 Tax=Geosporobacter subterraneus DSM 17957 TaxID=1121919 RepID=A0A1M6Q266_9FIRM|nr:ABC transporter substrate binding protein [Geosporobacter subterraneus]SHK14166.1 PAS domain S-box-containing protein/diguanylate cyclase (GGDEF) domain-containing protein [Geosporobacter subterraneus DSM 17957]